MKARINSLLLIASLFLSGAAMTHAGNFSVVHSFGDTNKVTGFFPSAALTQGPDGTLYGINGSGVTQRYTGTQYLVVQEADPNVYGAIYAVNPDGSGFRTLHVFTNTADGNTGYGGMVLVGDTLYGTTYAGGSNGGGIIFSINTNGSSFQHLYDFGGVTNDGANPYGTLVYANGALYGTTDSGGHYNLGTVFSINTSGGTLSNIVNFDGTNGSLPFAGVTLCGNTLFGTTETGGGVLFKVNTNGSGFSILQQGLSSFSPLFLTNNVLYGAAMGGGSYGNGQIFSLTTDGSNFTTIYNFSGATLAANGLYTNSDGRTPVQITLVSNVIYGLTLGGGTNGYGTLFSLNPGDSAFATLHALDPSGYPSYLESIFSSDRLYGALSGDGYGYGCLYSMNLDGSGYTNFFKFAGSDGCSPGGQLLLTNGFLYGETGFGGVGGYGTVFRLGSDGGNYTNLYNFDGTTASQPTGGLMLLSNTFYGSTASYFGSSVIFALDTDGSGFTNIYSTDDGNVTSLAAASGELFGRSQYAAYTTYFTIGTNGSNYLGKQSCEGPASPLATFGGMVYGTLGPEPGINGAIFSLDTSGFNEVYDFTSSIGSGVGSAPPLLVGDTFFGITSSGGVYAKGSLYSVNTNGSNFTILHSFSGTDGRTPSSPLTYVNGELYGTTSFGGAYNYGNIYSIYTNGSGFAVHYTFTNGIDGKWPGTSLVLSGNTLYGTSAYGGSNGMGNVFALAVLPVLTAQVAGGNLVLYWTDPNFSLQTATAATGTYITIASAASPYTNVFSGTQQYYRLISN